MKLTKTQLKEMIKEAVQSQLDESGILERRVMKLDRFRSEVNLSSYELLEDIVEMLDEDMWRQVVIGLKDKYGYKI